MFTIYKTSYQKTLFLQKIIYFTGQLNHSTMDVKIDTKEKFTVITPKESEMPANMTAELNEMLLSYLSNDIPHVILNMKHVNKIDEKAAEMIAGMHQQFYEQNASFIVCELQKEMEKMLNEKGFLETMNSTPTESEAWDIAQMEEIERELLSDFDNNHEQ